MAKWILRWFCSIFSFKLPTFWHTSEVSLDCKCIKMILFSYFYNGKRNCVHRFSVKPPNIWENRVEMRVCVHFWMKVAKKRHARKPIAWNSSSTTVAEKWKISWDVFLFQKIMHPNFTHFYENINLKSALKSFASVSGHLRSALSISNF